MESQYESLSRQFQDQYGVKFDTADMERFFSLFKPQTIARGACFIKAGEKTDHIGIVVKGLFRYFYIDPQGNDHTKHFAAENWAISAYTAHITANESKFSIEALEDSDILMSRFTVLERWAEEDYNMLLFLKKIVDRALILKEERESSFLLENGTERYLRFRNEYPDLDKRVKQYHLASYLGLTPVTLCRIRKKLQIIK